MGKTLAFIIHSSSKINVTSPHPLVHFFVQNIIITRNVNSTVYCGFTNFANLFISEIFETKQTTR